jgi:aryl-alcohol dehydrogenase-like predicted oxidoreductase
MTSPHRPRTLGKTGVHVPAIGYGTAPLGREQVTRAHAVRCLNYAIDRGITFLDTAADYGSEPHVGAVMRHRRDDVFLATKVIRPSRLGVIDDLRQSLARLETDYVDLVQLDSIYSRSDLESALAPGGALAALEQARKHGMTRFIGLTGHARPEVLADAIECYPFDTLLVGLGMADRLVASPETTLLPIASRQQLGIIAMKSLGHGCFQVGDIALKHALAQPEVTLAVVGLDGPVQIDESLELAAKTPALVQDIPPQEEAARAF